MMPTTILDKTIGKVQTMKKVFKLTITASMVALFTACGGGGGGTGDVSMQAKGDNSVAELAQKIINGFNIVSATTIVIGSND